MKRVRAVLFFVVVALLVFWKVLFHREFTLLSGSDTAAAYFPWFDAAAFWLKKGIFLLWDPYVYSGKAFMGEPQPGLFYPLNWLFLLLPARGGGMNLDGMQVLFVLHYLLASIFFFLLARSFGMSEKGAALAGIAWAYGGFTAVLYGYANVLGGFTWMPLVFLFYRRALLETGWRPKLRQAALAGFFLAFCFLPGHHIPLIHTGLFLFFYTVYLLVSGWTDSGWRERLGSAVSLATVPVVAALLTAHQWLPSAEWGRRVYRWVANSEPLKWGQAVPYSALEGAANMSPQDFLSLLLPYVSSSANIYTGIAVPFLALAGALFSRGREHSFFLFGAVLYFFLSWGRFSALHGWLNTFVPGVWFGREVFYYLVPFQACLAMLAGFGLDRLAGTDDPAADPTLRRFLRIAVPGTAFVAVLAGAGMAALYYMRGVPMDHPYFKGVAGLAAYAVVTGLLVLLKQSGRISAPVFQGLLVALIVVDLSSHLSDDIRPKTPPQGRDPTWVREVWRKPPAAEFLAAERKKEVFRIDDPDGIFRPNFGDAWRLEATMGHGATALVSYFEFRGTGWGPSTNATALLNARYIVSRVPIPGMTKVFGESDGVYLNPRAVPRAFIARRYRRFPTTDELLRWIPTPLFAPGETVLLTDAEASRVPPELLRAMSDEAEGFSSAAVSYIRDSEKKLKAAADDDERRRLLIFHPPWGSSDGDELRISVRLPSATDHCYLVARYTTAGEDPSVLTIRRSTGGETNDLESILPGLVPGETSGTMKRAALDLGRLEAGDHLLALVRDSRCVAAIDSLRVTRNPSADSEPGVIRITSFKPNRVRLHAEMKRPGFAVLSEVHYPGWEALVDGQAVPLLEADYVLRAVPLPAGSHEVEVRFRPRSFLAGLAITAVSLLGICWVARRRTDA